MPRSFRTTLLLAAALLGPLALSAPAGRLAVLAPPAIDVAFEEWATPTPKSFPHDPAVAPDGSAWYTGMRANVLGRLDPKTGDVKEFKLPTANSGPHGIVADKAGNIWYTGNYSGLIGKLDPATGKVTEYKMPDAKARDPHTLIFDDAGTLWFTVQASNFVGRLDPKSGKVDLVPAPTPDSRPYGIVVNSRGVPFFDLFNTNKIGRIDPASLAIREYTLPDPGARPRRIAVGRDDIVYYTDFARGMLGRLDPATGKVTEFASPGGPKSQPYGMAVTTDGAVWFSESGIQPNTLVRFDPGTRQMQAWPIPSGGGVVRHMVAAPNDELWLACSGVDRIARARWKTAGGVKGR